MADVTQKVKEKFHSVPDSATGKHWLFWLSLIAVSATVVSTLRQAVK